MLWVKFHIGNSKFWYELQAETEIALQQISGMRIAIELFTDLPVQIVDTRYSKHPLEQTLEAETIKQIMKDLRNRNEQNLAD